MTRVPVAALCLAAAGVAFVGARQEPTFRSGTNTVSVYTTVLDESGRLATDLTKGDFEVLDNGKPQELTVFANDLQPITIVIMLDRSGSMERNFDLVRDAAERFVGNLDDEDKARVGSFSNRVQIDPATFTSDHNTLIRILRENLQGPGMTPLWNATAAAMTALRHEEHRKVVLVFTDGYNTPEWSARNATFSMVRERSQVESVMIYAIGLADTCGAPPGSATSWPGRRSRYQEQRGPGGGRGPGGRVPIGRGPSRPGPMGPIGRGPIGRFPIPMPGGPGGPWGPPPGDGYGRPPIGSAGRPCIESTPDPDLRELAAVSGGGYFELTHTDDLSETFARVADELHHQYLLAFAPTAADGQLHTIEVRVRQTGMTARARQSYMAPSAPAGSAPQPR